MKVGEENFQILANEDKKEYTKVTFHPDLRRFNMEKLDDHIAGLMARRAFDLAGTCKGVKVKLNTKEIKVVYRTTSVTVSVVLINSWFSHR